MQRSKITQRTTQSNTHILTQLGTDINTLLLHRRPPLTL